jgi:hypothetical protein
MCGVLIFMRSAEMSQRPAFRSNSAHLAPINSLVRTKVNAMSLIASRVTCVPGIDFDLPQQVKMRKDSACGGSARSPPETRNEYAIRKEPRIRLLAYVSGWRNSLSLATLHGSVPAAEIIICDARSNLIS